jgi:hypothetical protein
MCALLLGAARAVSDDWQPISDWIERLLFSLLRWPERRTSEIDKQIEGGILQTLSLIDKRLAIMTEMQHGSSDVLFLPMNALRPDLMEKSRPLRACVVQPRNDRGAAD